MVHSSVALEKDEAALIAAAKAGDETAFRDLIEPLGRELAAYAYRMLGGFQDAEDALQETRLKVWRHLASYEHGSSFRAWVYRIATNTCLDMSRKERRRVLPQDVGAPPVAPGPPTTEMRSDIAWLEPYPDALLPSPSSPDPEATLRLHESVRLAFIRAMQLLPPRQRAALILHDVLDFRVDDIASMLETTAPAINSALQRARASVQAAGPGSPSKEDAARIAAQKAEAIAELVRAWETGNFDRLVTMLTEDAVMSMPPWIYWLAGRDAVAATFLSSGTWEGEPRSGRYRIVSVPMNGQPAGLAYVEGADGRYVPVCLTVMDLDAEGRVFDMTVFVLPQYFDAWGVPASLE
jgi:RNA polymerase sigma-70 factor (ECF subfamily)